MWWCCCAHAGGALSLLGESVSAAYQAGVKTAISDYYNDQVREIYATRPDEVALKEVRIERDRVYWRLAASMARVRVGTDSELW